MKSLVIGLLLGLLLFLLALPQVLFLPLLDRDETRFSEAGREMLQSGDFVVPTCNGLPRYQKPPLFYWVQAASFAIFGESELSARLPSILATTLTALVIFIWARRVGETQSTALTAALLSALTLQMQIQGRVATADGLLIFFLILSSWCGWEWICSQRFGRSFGWVWIPGFTLALAFGFLTKGPLAWMPLIPVSIYLTGRARGLAFGAWSVSLLLVLLWAIPAYLETKGDYWRAEIGTHLLGHATSAMDGHGATSLFGYGVLLPFYFLTFALSFLPISPLLITHRKSLFSNGWLQDQSGLNFYLLSQAALIFLVFTFMVSKLPHYTLPAFPLLALLFARRWASLPSAGWRKWLPFGLTLTLALAMAIGCVFLGDLSPAKALVRAAEPDLNSNTEFAAVQYQERSVTWEMRRVVDAYQQDLAPEEALNFLALSGPRALFLPTSTWRTWVQTEQSRQADPSPGRVGVVTFTTPDTAPLIDPAWKVFHHRGLDSAKLLIWNKTGLHLAWIDLTLIVKRNTKPRGD